MTPSVLDRVGEAVLDRAAPGWQSVFPAESGAALAEFCAEWEARDAARERNEVVGEAEDVRQHLRVVLLDLVRVLLSLAPAHQPPPLQARVLALAQTCACGRAHRHVARSLQGQHPDPQLPQALRRPAEAPTHGCDGEGRALPTRNRPTAPRQRHHQRHHPPHALRRRHYGDPVPFRSRPPRQRQSPLRSPQIDDFALIS